jgi:alkaline phosphatase D
MITRRTFAKLAASIGASAAWGKPVGKQSRIQWHDRPAAYSEGVASADPDSNSVLLWTRHPTKQGHDSEQGHDETLTVEVSEDDTFRNVVATARAIVSKESDWTCRVLVGGLKPARVYWYRFTDREGSGSRIGRTITAPSPDDPRPVRFAFISCQNANHGAQNAYRRMIFEDERAAEEDRLGFVLHLGDFIYEIVWYPEDRPQGMYDRRLRDIVRYDNGEKIDDFHIPTTLADYRAIYRAYLRDPDLLDARARWPFVNMWDNHEFSWLGYQCLQIFKGVTRSAQTRKVAANQAFFEYQPARMSKPSGPSMDRFNPPNVVDAAISHFDENGLGQEPNNLAAINSLKGYRKLRWGRHVDLIITDQHSYRSEDPTGRVEAKAFSSRDFPELVPEEAVEILDAGLAHNQGHPPDSIRFGDTAVPNFRKEAPCKRSWALSRRLGFSSSYEPPPRPGRYGEIQPALWICGPIRKTCRRV